MADVKQLEFFLLRYVPDAVKDEFVNIGVALMDGDGFADVRFTRDWSRVRCLDPAVDLEILEALESDLRERLREGDGREKFLKRITESLSGSVQMTSAKGVLAEDPATELDALARIYLERAQRAGKRSLAGRQAIYASMRDAFEQAGVWALMRKRIPVEKYTRPGDPLKLDCGYRPNGVIKLFHAVSLASDVDAAKVLAFSWPQIAAGLAREEHATASLTAIVEDGLDRADEQIAFALATMDNAHIGVRATSDLPGLAAAAKSALHA